MSISSLFNFLPTLGETRPDLFSVQWGTVIDALGYLVVLSFLVERFLSVLFESEPYILHQKLRTDSQKTSQTTLIAFVVSVIVCMAVGFDILAIITQLPQSSYIGIFITGGVVAGGSKASLKLFRDVLDLKSNAYREQEKSTPTVTANPTTVTNPQG